MTFHGVDVNEGFEGSRVSGFALAMNKTESDLSGVFHAAMIFRSCSISFLVR